MVLYWLQLRFKVNKPRIRELAMPPPDFILEPSAEYGIQVRKGHDNWQKWAK
jgi:hypothetical protein